MTLISTSLVVNLGEGVTVGAGLEPVGRCTVTGVVPSQAINYSVVIHPFPLKRILLLLIMHIIMPNTAGLIGPGGG
jgi:hypothetical protein